MLGGGGGGHGGQRRGEKDAAPHAGKWYYQFVEEVNDAQEERDAQLTLLEVGLGIRRSTSGALSFGEFTLWKSELIAFGLSN